MTVPLSALVPLGLAGVLLAGWRPQVAVLLPLIFHAGYLVRSAIPIGGFVLPTTLLELLVWIAVASALGRRKAIAAELRAFPKIALALALAFLLAATISAAIAPHPRTAWGHWKAFVVEPIVYAIVLLPTLREKGGRSLVARSLLLGGMVAALLSLAVADRTPDFGRLRGVYDVPNSLALVLAPLAVFALVLAVGGEGTPLRRLARWAFAIFVPVLFLTQSLAGLLAVVVGGLVVLQRGSLLLSARKAEARSGLGTQRSWWRAPHLVVTAVTMLVLAAGLGWQAWRGKLAYAVSPASSFTARVNIWQVSFALIRDHSVLGTGLGTFEPAYQAKLGQLLAENSEPGTRSSRFPARKAPRATGLFGVPGSQFPLEWLVRDPHNVVLSFWLHTGLLGLLSMASLVVLALRSGYKLQATSSELASGAALLALLVFGLVDVPYFKNDLSLLWWVFLAMALAKGKGPSTPWQTAG